jgi:hypothetical protein
MEKVTKVKASTLVFDFSIYPRHKIELYHVHQMAETLRAGGSFPPIIVERKTKRVVDGWHRTEAYRKVYGLRTAIPVVLKDWPDEASMREEAVRLNATHGRILTKQDKARSITLLEEVGLVPERIAAALSMTVEALGELKAERLAQYEMAPVALKATARHLVGRELTSDQVEFNRKAGGLNQSFYINQVISMLEKDAVDWDNKTVVSLLKKLHGFLQKALSTAV